MARGTGNSGILIPRNPKKDELVEKVDNLSQALLTMNKKDSKEYKEIAKEQQKALVQLTSLQQEEAKKMNPVMGFIQKEFFSPARFKFRKMQQKVMDKYNQYIVKGKFFKKIGDHLKRIAEQTGSFLWKFLKALFLMAIFDPKGKFLGKIIGFLVKAVTWVLNAVAKQLPSLIKNMANILFNILPKALNTLVNGIFKAISGMFQTWIDQLPKDSVLRSILEVAQKLFGQNGPIAGFFSLIADFAPAILMAVGALKAFFALKALFAVIAAHPVIAIISLVILGLMALWKWKDKIASFFEGIFDWFSKLGTGMKVLIGILALLFWPVTAIAAAIYGLVKLFQSFAKIGVAETFSLIWEKIKGAFSKIGSFLWKWFKKGVTAYFKQLKKVFWDFPQWLGGKIMDGLKYLFIELPTKLNETLKNVFMGVFNKIAEGFNNIVLWFKTIANMGIIDYFFNSSDKERKAAEQATRLVESAEEYKEKTGKAPKKFAEYIQAGKSEENFEKLMDKISKMQVEVVEKKVKEVEQAAEAPVTKKTALPARDFAIIKQGRPIYAR